MKSAKQLKRRKRNKHDLDCGHGSNHCPNLDRNYRDRVEMNMIVPGMENLKEDDDYGSCYIFVSVEQAKQAGKKARMRDNLKRCSERIFKSFTIKPLAFDLDGKWQIGYYAYGKKYNPPLSAEQLKKYERDRLNKYLRDEGRVEIDFALLDRQ